MTKLILGCGYLGKRVALLWRQRGERVLGSTRKPMEGSAAKPPPATPLPFESLHCDVLDTESLKQLPRADTVLYAVGFDRTSGQTMRRVYVEGLRNVLRALPTPGQFIHVSSSSVYGQTNGAWVDETAATLPEEESGKIVLEAEQVVREFMPAAKILRFAGIYGPGRWLRQKALEAGEPLVADPEKWLNLIHVADGARAILAIEERGQPGLVVNVCDGQPVRRRDFYTELARVLRSPVPRFVVPPEDMPMPPHEKANRRLANRRLVDELGFQFQYPNYREGLQDHPHHDAP